LALNYTLALYSLMNNNQGTGATISNKKGEKVDLEKIASQLASVKLLAIAGDEELILRATARFTTKSFVAGKYSVSVGIKQALLHLDHPSFERENPYQATLAKEIWAQISKNLKASHAAGNVEGSIGGRFYGLFGAKVKGEIGKDNRQSAEQRANTPYRIVSITPTGWQIGSNLGDPRVPDGVLPEGLEHCLNGEYLSGRNEEQGDGHKDERGILALCVLKVKPGGNDPHIVATLFAASESLGVAVSLSDSASPAQPALTSLTESRNREEELRKAFIEICLQRAQVARSEGARTDAMLSGELYLSHHEIHSPKLSKKNPSEKAHETKREPR
jgi:hypothetical protein